MNFPSLSYGPTPGTAPPTSTGSPRTPADNQPAAPAVVKRSPTIERAKQHAEGTTSLSKKLLIIGGFMLGAIALGTLGLVIMLKGKGTSVAGNPYGSEFRVPDKNFSFAKPPTGWETDNATRTLMNLTALVYKRSEAPDAWVALSVTDYDTRTPFVSELRDKMLEHLNRGFDDVPNETELQPVKWAGQDAHTARFRLKQKGTETPCILDATFATYRGFGYWCYTWAKQEDFDLVSEELEKLRNSFQYLGGRADRASVPVREFVYRNSNGKYHLKNFENIWKEAPGLKGVDIDPKGDLFLKAELTKTAARDIKPSAELLVMVLDEARDPAEVATNYIRERLKRNEADLGKVEISDHAAEVAGDAPLGPEGEPKSPVTRLHMRRGSDKNFITADKLIVYSAIRLGDQVVIAEASCSWTERQYWERRLVQLVGSLQK